MARALKRQEAAECELRRRIREVPQAAAGAMARIEGCGRGGRVSAAAAMPI